MLLPALATDNPSSDTAFPKAPALLEPHHQIVWCHIQDTLQRCSQCILQLQLTGLFFLNNVNIKIKKFYSVLIKAMGPQIENLKKYIQIYIENPPPKKRLNKETCFHLFMEKKPIIFNSIKYMTVNVTKLAPVSPKNTLSVRQIVGKKFGL